MSLTSLMLWVKKAHAGLSAFPAAHIRPRSKTYKTQKSHRNLPSSPEPEIAQRSRGDTPADTQAHTRITTGVGLDGKLHRPRAAWAQKTQKDMRIYLRMARECSRSTGAFTHVGVASLSSCVRAISERGTESVCVTQEEHSHNVQFVKSPPADPRAKEGTGRGSGRVRVSPDQEPWWRSWLNDGSACVNAQKEANQHTIRDL